MNEPVPTDEQKAMFGMLSAIQVALRALAKTRPNPQALIEAFRAEHEETMVALSFKMRVNNLRTHLVNVGKLLSEFGTALMRGPENVVFSGAPGGLGNMPAHLIRMPAFIWGQIPNKESIAQGIQDLRGELQQLENLRRQLGEG